MTEPTENSEGAASALEPHVRAYATSELPTAWGTLTCHVYKDDHGVEHVALSAGDLDGAEDVTCRLHSACLTSEAFGSLKCDCKEQLDRALERVAREGRGIVIYLPQEGRGIGLGNKIRAYDLQERHGLDTVDANRHLGLPDDTRDYGFAAAILHDLGIKSVALMTNNPLKIEGLERAGVAVSRRLAHVMDVGDRADAYVQTKQKRMGHLGRTGEVIPLKKTAS
jgi:GTP cyclohydrolase II